MANKRIKPKTQHLSQKLGNKSINSSRFNKTNLAIFAIIFASLGGYLIFHSKAAVTCDLNATTSNFSSQVSAAQPGQTLCLASGSYGSWNGTAKASPGVLITANGASVSFSGGDFGSSVRYITIQGVTYTGPVCVSPGSTPLHLVFDGDTWGNVGQGCGEGRLTIRGGGGNAVGSNGVQIKNSTFGPQGCSDGIQDSSNGTEIGPNNEFKGIVQACGASEAHVDSIQPYASNYVWIHDNNFHDNEQGIMSPDGVSTGYLIENNVIHTSTGYPCMHIGDSRNGTIRHNVCRNGGIRVYGGNQGVNSQNMIVQNNISTGNDTSACSGCTIDHNLTTSQVTFTGGTGRCAYATASPKGTGSDGTDIGLNDCSGGTTPPPPPSGDTTAPTVSLTAPTSGSSLSGNVTLSATASDNVAVTGVQFMVDGASAGSEDTSSPYSISWDSSMVSNGSHSITAVARDAAGNTKTSTAVTVTTSNTTTCKQSSTAWVNNTLTSQTGTFNFDYDATPAATNIDAVTGLSSGAASDYTNLATIVRFNDTGTIDARDGANYAASASIPYSAGTKYHIKLAVNITNHTYTITVTPNGGSATVLGTNYAFRTEQATITSINNWALYALSGSHSVCAATVSSGTVTKVGDINLDGTVNIFDMSILLSNYNGTTANCDLNTDGTVNIFDMSILLSHYGT